jgi:hypothetical protein
VPDSDHKIVRFDRAMTERLEAVYGDILIWFRPGGFLQLEEDWTVIDLWELSEGHSVTITNAREDLPDWFELHPTETSGSLAREMLKRLDEGYQPGEIMDGPNLWRVMAGDRLAWIGASRTGLESIGGILSIVDFRCCALVVAEIDAKDIDELTAFGTPSRLDDPGAIALARHSATVIRRMGPARVLGVSPWTLGG